MMVMECVQTKEHLYNYSQKDSMGNGAKMELDPRTDIVGYDIQDVMSFVWIQFTWLNIITILYIWGCFPSCATYLFIKIDLILLYYQY